MRKIDEKQFMDYTVICDSFTIKFNTLSMAIKLFNERDGKCEIRGNRYDGTFAILDKKL